jgi:hypothetical protein
MKLVLLRTGVLACLITSLFNGQAYAASSCDVYGDIKPNENPSFQQLNCLLTNAALEANIPPEVVKAVATQENGEWRQFDEKGESIISDDGGIGLMQITNQPDYDQEKLKNDISYNIEKGIEILNSMYLRTSTDLPRIQGVGRQVIENWYFPVMAYNGIKPVNSPIVKETGVENTKAYQEEVFALIEKYSFLDDTQLAPIPFISDHFQYDPTSSANITFTQKEYKLTEQTHDSAYLFKVGDQVFVTEEDVKIRLKPGTSQVIGTVAENTNLIITGNFVYDLDVNSQRQFVWYPVKTVDNKLEGYISSAYITKANDDTIYHNWDEKTDVDPNHNWTIKFNDELDETTITNENIFIQYNQETIEGFHISLDEDKKSVKVEAPKEGYIPGAKYYLYIKNVKSVASKPLTTPVKLGFTIKQELDDAFTLVNESELNEEQTQRIDSWKKDRQDERNRNWEETKAVYRLDDLYIITAGWQPHPGYGLEVVKTEMSWEQVKVYVQVTKPNPNYKYPQVISYPYVIGKINLPPYTTLLFIDAETGEIIQNR